MGVLGVVDAIVGFLNGSSAGTPLTVDDVATPFNDIAYHLQIVDDVFQSADSDENAAVGAATAAAAQIEELGLDVKLITTKFIDVILPHSLSWVIGYVWSNGITPILIHLRRVDAQIKALQEWEAQIRVWRAKFVDPNIALWIGFREFFNGWPRGVLFRWHDYFENPAHFAQWATPPLVGPIIAYIAARDHQVSRDNLSTILVGAWQDHPEQIWRLVQEWLVSE